MLTKPKYQVALPPKLALKLPPIDCKLNCFDLSKMQNLSITYEKGNNARLKH